MSPMKDRRTGYGRGQCLGRWHRTKRYSSLVTAHFELRCELRGGRWLAWVDMGDGDDAGMVMDESPPTGAREEAEQRAIVVARALAAELLRVAEVE